MSKRSVISFSADIETAKILDDLSQKEGRGAVSHLLCDLVKNKEKFDDLSTAMGKQKRIYENNLTLIRVTAENKYLETGLNNHIETEGDKEIKENIEILEESQVDPNIKKRIDNADWFRFELQGKLKEPLSNEEIENLINEYKNGDYGLFRSRIEAFLNSKGLFYDGAYIFGGKK